MLSIQKMNLVEDWTTFFWCTYFWKQYFRNYVPSIVSQYMELGYSIWVNLIFSILNWFILIPVLCVYYLWTPRFEPPNLNWHYWGLVSAESELSTQQYLLWQTQVDRELRARLAVRLPHGTHAIIYSFIYVLWIFY